MNKELIAKAHEIIDGIPERKIDLLRYQKSKGEKLSCNTICCGAGWLALHPDFNAMGLTSNEYGWPVYKGEERQWALNSLFGAEDAFITLFAMNGHGRWDYEIKKQFGEDISDKQLLLQRLKVAYYGFAEWKEM